MEGDGMVAIVQGLNDCGLSVTVVNKRQFANSLRSTSPDAGSSISPRAIHIPDRGPANNTASQITDGHYTSTYQVAHCNARPTTPRDYVTEFPPQRPERCPNQGNFQIGSGVYSMAPETSRARNLSANEPSSLLGYSWLNDRSAVESGLSQAHQYDAPSRVAEVQPAHLSSHISPTGRESPTLFGQLASSGRQSPSSGRQPPSSGRLSSFVWASSPIPGPADSDQFANSLRKYPLTSPERRGSSEMLQKLLNYTHNKHMSKMSPQRTHSPHESPTRDVTVKNIQTYTRNKNEPTKDPGPSTTNKIQSNKPQKENMDTNLPTISPWRVFSPCRSISPKRSNSPKRSTSPMRSTSPKRTNLPTRSTSPKSSTSPKRSNSPKSSTSPKRTNSPERSASPNRSTPPKRANSPESISPRDPITPYKSRNTTTYDYLQIGEGRLETSGRKVEVRYLEDVRKCIRDTLRQIYEDTPPAVCPNVNHRYSRHRKLFHGDDEKSSWRVPAKCSCKKKRWPCICISTSKDTEELKLGAKIAEETFNWVKQLPVYADEVREDKVIREEMTTDLINNLKRLIGDPEFVNNARKVIAECIDQLRVWYPGGEKDQERFKNQITDELVNKLNIIVDKLSDIVNKFISGLEFTDNIDKGEVVNNIVKRLKPIADRPEDMETEIKDMLEDLPISNKTKVIENMSGKLVDDIASFAADEVLEKEIKKWVDYTPELSNDENKTKNSDKLAKKIRQALNRELDDINYQEVVREVVDDWIEEITSGENKLSTRIKANLADELVKKLKTQEKFKPQRRKRSSANQEEYVNVTWNWLENNVVIPEEKRKNYEDSVNNLAKKLQELQSSGAGDYKTEEEIKNFLDHCSEEGETIVNKNKLAKQLVADLKKTNGKRSSLGQHEDDTSEWLAKDVGIPEKNRERYTGPVTDFAKKLQKLQEIIRGAGEDEIAEEIINLLDYFTEQGETIINKDKLVKKLVEGLKQTNRRPSLLKQHEDRTSEWLAEEVGIPEENRGKYTGPVKDFAKKMQKLQSRGAGEDEIAEEIINLLDYFTKQGETIINKDKLAKKLVEGLKKAYERPSLLEQYEDRTSEWLTEDLGIPEESREKYKGPVKEFAKKLQKLQSRGAGEDKIAEEIINLLDYFTEQGETIVNKDKLAKKLVKGLKKTYERPSLLEQNEDRTSKWLTEDLGIPEKSREKYKGPLKEFANKLQKLQSKGAGEDKIAEEIINLLDYFIEQGETIVNKDKLAKKLIKSLQKSYEKPSLLEQYEDRTSEWLTEVVDKPEEHIEKYKGPVKELAKKLQELLSIEADDDEIAEEIQNFYNYLTNEGETVVKKENLAKKLIKDILSLGEQNRDIPKSKKKKPKINEKFSNKTKQRVKSSGTSDDETTGVISSSDQKYAKNSLKDKKTSNRKPGLKEHENDENCQQELVKEKVDTEKVNNKKSKGDSLNKKMQGSGRTSDDEMTDVQSMVKRNTMSESISNDPNTDRKPSLGKQYENELTPNFLTAFRKQSILKEITDLIEDLPSNISKSTQNELVNNIAETLTENFNNLTDQNNKTLQDIKNLLMKAAKISDEDASKIVSAINNRVKYMRIPKTSTDQTQYSKSIDEGSIHDIMKEFDIHPYLKTSLAKCLTDLDAGTVSTEKTKQDISTILQEAGLSVTDANYMADILLMNKNLTLRTEDSVIFTKRRSTIGPKELSPMQRENFVEIAEKEISEFVKDLTKDNSTEAKKIIEEKLVKLAQILGEIMSDPTVKDKKNAALGQILDFFNNIRLKSNTPTDELTKLLADRILNIGFHTSTPKNEGLLPQMQSVGNSSLGTNTEKVATSQRPSHIDEAYHSTSVPVQDSNEFIKENLKGGLQDWLTSLPLYQRKNSREKRDLQNMIPRLVSAITSVIENASTAVEADKLFIEEIVKQLKKSSIEAELKSDESFLRKTAAALLENLNELQLFQDISDRQETFTDALQILDDWMRSLPLKRLKSSEAIDLEKLKKDFASNLEKMRKKDPNDDENIKKIIHKYLFNFPIEESKKKNHKLMQDIVEKLFRNLLIVPIKESEYKSKVDKKAADILFDDIENWCEKLLFKSTSPQANQEIAKKEIASKLINKIGELNMNPEVFNDEFLYIQMFEDELDNLLTDMSSGDDKNNMTALKNNLLEKVKEARQKTQEEIAGQTYKHQLRDAISKTVPFQTLSAEERAAFEAVKDILVDTFINLHYVGDNEEQKQNYKTNIKKELSKFCDDYLQNHGNVPLDTAKLNENLYQALKAVPVPKDETLIPEVNLAKAKEEVKKWVNELPLGTAGDEKLKVDKMAAVLAKKICDIEKQNELEHNTDFDNILTKAISQWMDKLPKHPDGNIKNTYANKLVDNLRKTRDSRRVNADMRRSIDAELDGTLNKSVSCEERCKLPCSHDILSLEDMQHLEQIRTRSKSTQQKETGSQTATPPSENKGQQQEAASPAEVVPRLIVKEYYWDTASSQFIESLSPCSRDYPPLSPICSPRSPISSPCSPISLPRSPITSRHSPISRSRSPISCSRSPISCSRSPIYSPRSPISPSCSMNSPIYSPLPGSCLMQHRLYSPASSNARIGSPKHTALSHHTLESDPCRSENRPGSYHHQATGYEQRPSPASSEFSQRRPSMRPDDHQPCSPCPFGVTETPPTSYHRAEIPSAELHCRGHCAKTMLGVSDRKPCRKFRGDRDCWRQKVEDCTRAQPFGKRRKPEGFSGCGNFRNRNEEMKRCSKCCGIHCPFPSDMYFK